MRYRSVKYEMSVQGYEIDPLICDMGVLISRILGPARPVTRYIEQMSYLESTEHGSNVPF